MEEKKVSATSLLDVTPSPPRDTDESVTLELADSDPSPGTPPPSGGEAPPSPSQVETQRSPAAPAANPKLDETPLANVADIAGPFEETPAASEAETRRVVMPGVVAEPPQSLEEIESSSLQEDNSDDEPAPLSLRDAIVEEKPMELSSEHETVSLRDLVVMPPIVEPDSTPPPPMRGALRTLPPDPGKFKSAAPPPTIMVDDAPPPSVRPKAPSLSPKPSVPPKGSVPPKLPGSAASVPPKRSLPPPLKKPVVEDEASSESARPAPLTRIAPATLPPAEAEEPKRSVIVPALAIAVAGFIFWRIMSSPSKVEAPPTPTTTTTATATAEPSATETASAAPSSEPAASESASAAPTTDPPAPSATVATSTTTSATPTPKPTATATATATAGPTATTTAEPGDRPKPAAPVGEMSMGDMLDKAGSAKRSGDYPTARDLYERVLKQSPANVEANGGLGDVARAQGDASAAKASYQRALAASPSYSPALLGLADIEWDEGNRDSASARYGKIVEQMRGRAPQRARDRAPATE